MLRRKSLVEFLEPRTLFSTTFSVQFNDPTNTYLPYHDEIQSTLLAAAAEWSSKIAGTGSIEIQIDFDPAVPTAQTASTVSVPVAQTSTGIEVDEQGVTHEIRTGVDPNGADPDATITIGTNYLANELWFDPDPADRETPNAVPVPSDKVDAYSVFLHELVHAFGFNGNRDGITGVLPASADNIESTFDQYVSADNSGDLFFTGPHAKAIYGGPVPLTYANPFHVGNRAPRPGSDIADDLMNGVGFLRGHRYDISALDLAMLTDTGVPIIGTAPTLTISSVSHTEGDFSTTPFVFDVSLSSATTSPVSVSYSTVSGTALSNVDFDSTQGTLAIPAGQTMAAITVPIIANTVAGQSKSFTLALTDPVGVTLADSTVTGTIVNDDITPVRTMTFSAKSPLSYTDASGRLVTLTLSGRGSGMVSFDTSSADADADTITLAGTNSKSSLVVKARAASVRKIIDLSAIGTIDAHSVFLTSSLSAPVLTKLSLGTINNASVNVTSSTALTFSATNIVNSGVTAGSFKSFSASAISGSTIGAVGGITTFTANSLTSSTLFAGATTPPITLPGIGTTFTKRVASIKSMTVNGAFSNTIVTAPTIGTIKLGRVAVSNNHHSFGFATHSIASIAAATPALPHLKLTKLTKPARSYSETDFDISII